MDLIKGKTYCWNNNVQSLLGEFSGVSKQLDAGVSYDFIIHGTNYDGSITSTPVKHIVLKGDKPKFTLCGDIKQPLHSKSSSSCKTCAYDAYDAYDNHTGNTGKNFGGGRRTAKYNKPSQRKKKTQAKKKKNHVVVKFYKKWKSINGKLVDDIQIRRTTDNNQEVIKGHRGKTRIYIKRKFKSVTGNFPWDTRTKLGDGC